MKRDSQKHVCREQAVTFGPSRSLIGIVTSPQTPPEDDRPGVILLNSGLVHRVGVNRLHVRLARSFASQGFTTLRFDLSGIGDSPRDEANRSLLESVSDDIHSAFEYLETTRKKDRFVLMGLCSGAYDAFAISDKTPAVVGLGLLDLPGPFRNLRHHLVHYRQRLNRWSSWKNTFSGKNSVLEGLMGLMRRNGHVESEDFDPYDRPPFTRADMEKGFGDLQARGVATLLVFTAGVEAAYNHATQFREVFPAAASNPLVTDRFYADSDHVFGDYTQRQALTTEITRWLSSTFPQ